MEFNLNNSADIIFKNGNIYTQDPDLQWASAVACKDGKIIAVGDYEYMEHLSDEHTEIIDLDEKFMFPGFIDAHSSTILTTFKDTFLQIDSEWDLDSVLGEISDYCYYRNPDETILGLGFDESILKEYKTVEERKALLDDLEIENPLILIGADGMHLWVNSVASSIIENACRDSDVKNPDLKFILDALMTFDEDELMSNFEEEEERLTDKGYTTVFNMNSPAVFDNIYRQLLLKRIGDSDSFNQKIYGTLTINRPLKLSYIISKLEESKLFCTEIKDIIEYNTLKIYASSDYFNQNELNDICLAVADKGYNIHIDAADKENLIKACKAFELVRIKGYSENTLIIASDENLTKEEAADLHYTDSVHRTFSSDILNSSVFSHSINVRKALDNLTVNAAEIIGESDHLGSIEKGKNADFTVFRENIFETNLKTFSRLHCDMIVSNGKVLYDVDEENFDEMVNMLMNMQM